MPNLADLVKEWIGQHQWEISCFGQRIVYPCECGSNARYAHIGDDRVGLVQANCQCTDCGRTTVMAGDPNFFDILERSLKSRIDHKSVVQSNHIKSGDDIQHAVDHFKDGKIIFLEGTFENQQVNMKDCTLVISGEVTSCAFNNIKDPIETKGDATIVGCEFWMSPLSPHINDPYI